MKRCVLLLWIVFLWISLIPCTHIVGAKAEEVKESRIDHFLGGWLNDEFRMYIRLEGDEICCRLSQSDGDDVWELSGFDYDVNEERLYCMNCIHYREHIDWDTYELVQEDWSLSGLVFAYFTFKDDEDTLIACDIPYINEDLKLQRKSDEEYFG